MAFWDSNSSSVRTPWFLRSASFDSCVGRVGALGAGGLAHVLVEGLLLQGGLLGRPLVHRAAADDQVHEHPEERAG